MKPMKVKKHYEQDHVMLYVEDEGLKTIKGSDPVIRLHEHG